MDKSLGQKYTNSFFFGGLGADVDPELLEPKTGVVLEAHCMGVSRTFRNALSISRGDKSFASRTVVAGLTFIGGVWLNGYAVTFYRSTSTTYIWANNTLIGQHADYPSHYLDIDSNDEQSEMFITDNYVCPVVLNLNEMLAAATASELTYKDDYDHRLYDVNKSLQLNQPVFVQLEDLGAGGGLKIGSYAYAMCYASKSGENTPWSPITPYIPVPESAVSVASVDDYFGGIKTWGGETSLTPGRYGIRLRLRIANLSGFDYVKLKRLANYTGQPISYTPLSEFIILSSDASGAVIDPKVDTHTVIEFVDSDSKDWAILDDSVTQTYSTISKARTIRYFNRRVVLGGVEYKTKLLDDNHIFLLEDGINRIAFPIVKSLGSEGFANIQNQVYYKSHRLGERYGFGVKLYDDQGNVLFTVPLKGTGTPASISSLELGGESDDEFTDEDGVQIFVPESVSGDEAKDDFTNFKFPERRDIIPVGVKRMDTIALSGTSGSATIICNGVTGIAVHHLTTTQTAIDFVTEYQASYAAVNVLITAYLGVIRFTSTIAGTDFIGDTTIAPIAGGDLSGIVVSHANVTPVRQVDVILLNFQAGYADITCNRVTRTLVCPSSSPSALAQAVTEFADPTKSPGIDYHNIGIDIAYISGAIQFTGPADGSTMTTSATGTLISTTSAVTTTVTPIQLGVRVDTIAVTAGAPFAVGIADVVCNSISRPITWRNTYADTLTDFVTSYAADFLPVVLTTTPMYLHFTGVPSGAALTTITTRTGGNLSGSVAFTNANVVGVPEIRSVQTVPSLGGDLTITCNGYTGTAINNPPTSTIPAWITANRQEYIDHGAVSNVAQGSGGSVVFTGLTNGADLGTLTVIGDCYDHIDVDQLPTPAEQQVDTITLSGTSGNVKITCKGLARGLTFITSLTLTAARFETYYKATYAAIGVDVVASGTTIRFTALTAGDSLGVTTIVNSASNVGGTVTTVAGTTARSQVDVVTLLGTSGSTTISCKNIYTDQTVTQSVTFSVALDVTAINFYDNFHTLYEAIGITVAAVGDTIVFTGPATGTAILTTATGTLVDNIYTTVAGEVGEKQIETVTLTGSSGNFLINWNDYYYWGGTFDSTLTITAANFVLDRAAFFLLNDIVLTSSGSDLIFTAVNPGVGFGTITITNEVGTLDGVVTNVIANSAGGGEISASPDALEDSTVNSWDGGDVAHVYDPVTALRKAKEVTGAPPALETSKNINILDLESQSYSPILPTGRGSGTANNNYDDIFHNNIMDTVDGHDNNVGQYGRNISTIGLRIGGVDVSKLSSNIKSFSVVRTPPAGRVVCQGIGIYSLTELEEDANNPALTKALNKLWFFSPEIDSVIGNKSSVYEDIKTHPESYQVQLVAPCGFFSDFYSSYTNDGVFANQDFVSMPICGAGVFAKDMFPPDHDASIGESNYITFGKWRNTVAQGAGIDATLTFNLASAIEGGVLRTPSFIPRVPYLELVLGVNDDLDVNSDKIYVTTDVNSESSTTPASKAFHEPWYIINIIQDKNVSGNNISTYNDIGHSIRIESVIGISTGEANQIFTLVEERPEDVEGQGETATTYRYIYVDGNPWLDANNISNINGYLMTLEATGKFTPTNGLECYGIYTYDEDINAITFPHVFPGTGASVVPSIGTYIVVKYNENSPIEVFLGDTYVADASFFAIDNRLRIIDGLVAPLLNSRLQAPMPHYNFTFKSTYLQPNHVFYVIHPKWECETSFVVGGIRQWLIYFTCESTVNLSLAYKNFYPNQLYVQKPLVWNDIILEDETYEAWLVRMNIFPQYIDDLGITAKEYYESLPWGGLSTPSSVNYDYEKSIPIKSYSAPKSGAEEILSYQKRVHWSTQNIPGYDANKVFIPTNIYDLKNDKASQISILYDQYSERGSNLYIITDHGAGMLLTNKQMITTAEGNNLVILTQDASLINGEVWLSNSIGCPSEFWRGKSEGSVKLPNNIVTSVLVFPGHDDIMMFNSNNFVRIADNNRKNIVEALESVDLTGDFVTKLYSVIDEGENKLWMNIGNNTYAFNFDLNNWDGHLHELIYDKSFNARYLVGVNDRNSLVHAINTSAYLGLAMSHRLSTRVHTIGDLPYVVFSITPGIGRSYEFLDAFISASIMPYSVQVALTKDFADPAIVYGTSMKNYAPGLQYIQRFPRTAAGEILIGKTLYVKITFPDTLYQYDLKLFKTGYKEITGG